MSRFTDLFQEPAPEQTPEPVKVEEVVEVKTEKVIKAPKKKFTMD
jgi:hypothetical protein